MLINCDIGERGIDHPVDNRLMEYIHIANIACGGHAGDRESVGHFRNLAADRGVSVAAHLSYPDRENFGRKDMDLPLKQLLEALEGQYALIDDVKRIKLHGALYNRSAADEKLACELVQWFERSAIEEVLCPPRSALALACREKGITPLPEAFAERTYSWDNEAERLVLTHRSSENAHIRTVEEAFSQYKQLRTRGTVEAWTTDKDKTTRRETFPLKARTICIHSDSPIALELAERLFLYEQTF